MLSPNRRTQDTLAAVVYTNALGKKTDARIVLQRCLIALGVLSIPSGVLWCFIEPVLVALGQPPQLAADTAGFLRGLLLGAPGFLAFESVKKFLQVQGGLCLFLERRRLHSPSLRCLG